MAASGGTPSALLLRSDNLTQYPMRMGERYMFISPEGVWSNLTAVDGRQLFRFTVVGYEDRLDSAQVDMDSLVRRAFGRDVVPFELMCVLPWRRCPAERISSTQNYAIWVERKGHEKVLEKGPDADAQRRALGEQAAVSLEQEFRSLGIAMGYQYSTSPVIVPDGSPAPADDPSTYIQIARPGHRAPHYWLDNERFIIDLFGTGFVLLGFGDDSFGEERLLSAARSLGMPVDFVRVLDSEAAQLYERKLVLVRPEVWWHGVATRFHQMPKVS
ncbi:uncharacterized protein A1O9_12460 [Exophiala aquamarina CBS 119918]|uniref:Uncharacterized protein n=1 Tax=Exophiala aquamarina CBS 119918 TaxID=1182545 RepID=A0A072NWX8_9EURO|nr:uncharacterized protein A1O9_12460 [Exophiala aquamarina CBS 119918]KEF51543.1 hypothetical protein A1O9_12460 [Exophiala aquamarina CBS 119918]